MMTTATSMDDILRLRQFWLRCLLAFGMMWGVIPLITLAFITRGMNDSSLDVWAAVSNGFTIFPASLLAFWHRRVACIWFMINGILVVTSMISFMIRTHELRIGSIFGAIVSALLCIVLTAMEIRRWPDALV